MQSMVRGEAVDHLWIFQRDLQCGAQSRQVSSSRSFTKGDRQQQITSHGLERHRASPPEDRGRNAVAADDSAGGRRG